jgi:tRNA(Ile)-lysidine synthase
VHRVAHKVLDYIRRDELLRPGDRVGVAVSGGIDSVALLRILLELRAELGVVLSVVHLNHKLRRKESDRDADFVANLARAHGLELHSTNVDVAQEATQHHVSIETAARHARYDYFAELLGADPEHPVRLDKIATGHTLDDQAETVLMRVIRGTGMRGLSGIRPRLEVQDVDDEKTGEIIRPLLETRRHELETYLKDLGQCWREDATNRDPNFTRNRVRGALLPMLQRDFNPSIAETLSELAEISYGEEDYWHNEVAGWMGTRIHWTPPDWASQLSPPTSELVQLLPLSATPQFAHKDDTDKSLPHEHAHNDQPDDSSESDVPMNASVDLLWLLGEPLAVQRRAIKAVGDYAQIPLEFKHVESVLRLAHDEEANGKKTALPSGWEVLREPESLLFLSPDPQHQHQVRADYEHELPLPGRAIVPEANLVIEAVKVDAGFTGDDHEQLFDAAQLSSLIVRNWRPGDRFWPAHTKAPKKVKELLQDLHLPQSKRRSWPVIVSGTEIIWVRGFPGPAKLRPKDESSEAVAIRALPLEEAAEVEQ